MATLTVGPSGEYQTLTAAVNASHNGDTIDVQAGTYINDFPTITDSITIQGVGGVAYFEATEPPPNEKAIMLVGLSSSYSNINVTIKDLGFENAQIPASEGGNAAGIKFQSGNLTVEDSYFAGNQMGLLTGNFEQSNLTVENSVFAGQTGETNGLSHQLYVGDIGTATIENNLFLADANGNQIKSRAEASTVIDNTINDGTGQTSYDIDLPNGGDDVVSGNTIVKGVNDPNTTVIAYGEEGLVWSDNSLTVSNNLIDNQLTGHHGIGVYNATSTVAQIDDNKFYNLPTIASGPSTQSGNVTLTTAPTVVDTNPITTIPEPTSPPSGTDPAGVAAQDAVATAYASWTSIYGTEDPSAFNHAVNDVLHIIETPGSAPPADTQNAPMETLLTALGQALASWDAEHGSQDVMAFNEVVAAEPPTLEHAVPAATAASHVA